MTTNRRLLGVLAVVSLVLLPAAVAWACNPQSYVRLDKATYATGEQMQVTGSFFKSGATLTLSFEPGGEAGRVTTTANGQFSTALRAPSRRGSYVIAAIGYEPDGRVTPGLPARASFEVQAADRDCSDFPNQAAAQAYFISQGGPSEDPDQLDGDGDGIACDSLPCPCSSGAPAAAPAPVAPPLRSPVFAPQVPRPNFAARVVRVVDGDTLRVRSRRGRRFTVRLLGIEAPEVFGARECGGRAASARLRRLAPRRRKVRVVGDSTQPTRDRYGRLLGYVTTTGGVDLSLAQLRSGWARVPIVTKPFKRYQSYTHAALAAKNRARGVWGVCGGDFNRAL